MLVTLGDMMQQGQSAFLAVSMGRIDDNVSNWFGWQHNNLATLTWFCPAPFA